MLKDLLQITRQIEQALELEQENPEGLASLLSRRREIAARLDRLAIPADEESLLREIRAGEKRCLARAAARKQELQPGLAATRTRRRLEKAYGNHR